jgi:hypothetical protein
VYSQDLVNCDGTDPNVILNKYCMVPMSAFLASPFNLVQGSSIIARVSSKNAINWSIASPLNTPGPLVQIIPTAPLTLSLLQLLTDQT